MVTEYSVTQKRKNMFRFANSELLFLLFIIPVLVLVFIVFLHYRKQALKKYGNLEIIKQLMPDYSQNRIYIKFIFVMLALTSIILALARPQFGSKLQEVKRKGVEVVIALDVSNSMMAEDIQPNRLERSKQAISRLVDKLNDDRIGLIVFAGEAYTQIPITMDYASAKMFLSGIHTDIMPVQGTALSTAIELGINSFTPDDEKNKAMIIITDGEDHEENAIPLAEQAKEKGITIHTVGMGLAKGVPIPLKPGSTNYRKDKEGNVVITKLNEKILQEIAVNTGGTYINGNNFQRLNNLYDEINKMDKKEFETQIYAEYEDQFQYLIALALFFLLLDYMILERKNKWLKNIDLFKV